MLSNHESDHCAKILRLLDSQSIHSLKDTITKGLIVVASDQEATNAVLEYSNNVLELLSRRKLKREVLLKYLMHEKVKVNPSDNKEVFIQSVLNHIQATCPSSKVDVKSSRSQTHTFSGKNSEFLIKNAATDIYCHQVASNIAEADQQIAKEFIQWFYPMLNSLKEVLTSQAQTWSATHFWPECQLRCKLPSDDQYASDKFAFETHEGCEYSAKRLSSFVTDSSLVFNANDTPNGYRGKINEHGMAKVAVCGTVHKHNPNGAFEMCGVFEQLFGLLRDPLDNNRWKIKFTDLSIQLPQSVSSSNPTQPSLSITAVNQVMLDE